MLDSQHVLFHVTTDSQEDTIRKVVALAADTGRIKDISAVVQAVLDREQEGTMALAKGLPFRTANQTRSKSRHYYLHVWQIPLTGTVLMEIQSIRCLSFS
ncbi:hypothetical protein GCM10025858_36390 [Alicyclobacillus sacchari]|nr:hypothetical protein GCM10025858_36390 [Alicyclobacillus sacchari]